MAVTLAERKKNMRTKEASGKTPRKTFAGLAAKVPPKKRRFRPGTVALREIARYQKTTENLIPKSPFRRLIREIVNQISPNLRMTESAAEALQEASEAKLVEMLEDSNLCAIHAHRVTIKPKDIHLTQRLHRDN